MGTTSFNLSATHQITTAEVAQYHKDGHILLPGVLSTEELEYYRPWILVCVDAIVHTHDV
jgi:hypothetical protein